MPARPREHLPLGQLHRKPRRDSSWRRLGPQRPRRGTGDSRAGEDCAANSRDSGETGVTDGVLRRGTRSNTVPKFFHVLTDSEYFNRAGSLVHTDVTGTRDIAPPTTSRIYFIASAPHIVGAFPPAPFADPDFVGRADMNTLVYTPVIRALFRALDRWVAEGVEPRAVRSPDRPRRGPT